MRRVNQLGFLVVNKKKPTPKRKIEDINVNTFFTRLNSYKYLAKLKTANKEEVFLKLESIADTHKPFDYQLVGNALRIVFEEEIRPFARNWNIEHIGFGSYQRDKRSYLFIFDYMKNETFIFIIRKPHPETELEIWEMSDLNYWG